MAVAAVAPAAAMAASNPASTTEMSQIVNLSRYSVITLTPFLGKL
jgi:hypothetical protein